MKATNRFVLYFSVMSIFIVFACSFVTGQPPAIDSTATSLPTKIPETPQTLISPNSLPLPNGLILKSATDTERDLSGYQVAYLEDAADGFSGANQSEIDMYFGENHNFSVHVNFSEGGGLVWATGWCAKGQETLSQNLKKIQFEMAVNGQPVDLNQVYRSDNEHSWHTTGDFCLFYRIIVSGLPSGTTTLTSKTTINEPVNDGHKDYPTGELTRTYEIINSASTSQIPNSSISGGPTLGSKQESQSAIDNNVKSLTSLAKDPPFKYNGTTRYDVQLNNSNEHLLWWSNGWCATNDKVLAQNLKQMSFELYINDQPIDADKAVSKFYKSSDGMSCVSYAIVMYGWTSDTTVLTSKIIIKASLNDGVSNYSAGDEFTKNIVINGQ